MMQLAVYSPLSTIVECKIKKVSFETLSGMYTLLPKHVDFVSALKPNILTYVDEENNLKYVACHRGIIVKKGSKVCVTVQNAVQGNSLDELKEVIKTDFKKSEEHRKELNTAMARLELGMLRGFKQLREDEVL